jgi:hypothetical protein
VKLATQPLPVLTEAQVKVAGPVHPAGREPKLVTDRFVAVLPSLVVKVTLSVELDPTTTLTVPVADGVATTVLSVVMGGADPTPPLPQAADAARLATTAHLLSNFRGLVIDGPQHSFTED